MWLCLREYCRDEVGECVVYVVCCSDASGGVSGSVAYYYHVEVAYADVDGEYAGCEYYADGLTDPRRVAASCELCGACAAGYAEWDSESAEASWDAGAIYVRG